MTASSTRDLPKQSGEPSKVQGEGDYDAARRFNESAKRFVAEHNVENAAHDASPKSPEEARELQEAERKGLEHAKGEDPQVKRP